MALHYESLVVWQRADDLFIEIHRLTYQRFPREEQFELGRQLRRAATQWQRTSLKVLRAKRLANGSIFSTSPAARPTRRTILPMWPVGSDLSRSERQQVSSKAIQSSRLAFGP